MHEESLVPLLSSPFLSRPGGMHDALRTTNVPVALLPVACSVMRGARRPGESGDWGILESEFAPSWCMVCGGPLLPIG